MKKNVFIIFVVVVLSINFSKFVSFGIASDLVEDKHSLESPQTQTQPQPQNVNLNLNLNKLKYPDFLKLYRESVKSADYEKALFYARFSFARAENIDQRSNALLLISDVYVAMGDYKKAKMLYRQIIQNYQNQQNLVKEVKSKLLKL
jgi:tetratricopeptide (TPR) repeat protein